MLVKIRKIVEEKNNYKDEETGRKYSFTNIYENGFVEEIEVSPREITAFSSNSRVRLIGIEKKGIFPMTLASWKATKKELSKAGMLEQFNYSKAR